MRSTHAPKACITDQRSTSRTQCASRSTRNASRKKPDLSGRQIRFLCWRRVRDSNPRFLSESLVFKTSSLNRSDNSPYMGMIPFKPQKVKEKAPRRSAELLKSSNQSLEEGIYGRRAPATLMMGMVCNTILPGPLTTVLNRPSPPKRTFLMPGTVTTSMVQVASIAAK